MQTRAPQCHKLALGLGRIHEVTYIVKFQNIQRLWAFEDAKKTQTVEASP